jgi:excisionase family DNA binding protein
MAVLAINLSKINELSLKKIGPALALTKWQTPRSQIHQGGKIMGLFLNKRFFRPDEVAQILALSRRTIYRMIRDGRLRGVRWGAGPWRIPRESLVSVLGGENR